MRALPSSDIAAAIASHRFGTASAAKRGRNPSYPYVPVIDHGAQATGAHATRTEQIKAMAFSDRAAAVDYAARVIESRKTKLAADLAKPNMRALREQYGLPRDAEPAAAPAEPDTDPLTVAGLLRDTFGVFALAFGMSGVAALVWLAQAWCR